jgi:nucleoside-diphosphate-sugar epimerase
MSDDPVAEASRTMHGGKTVLVAGASGLVGTAAVERFLADGAEVIAVSRRRPEVDSDRSFRHLALDLTDADACRAAAGALRDVTHVVFAAVYEMPGLVAGWTDPHQMAVNENMLRNLLDALTGGGLRHLSLLQGTKAYGAHLHPIRVPAREHSPRDPHANFYWLHEDLVRERSQADGWAFTIWRPQLIVGPNYGVVMNIPPVIGAYAAIRRAEGLPFSYPGGASWVWEAVDTRLLAEAMSWAADAPAAADEIFNITNGEVFEFRDMWPALATTLGVEVGPDDTDVARRVPAASSGVVGSCGARSRTASHRVARTARRVTPLRRRVFRLRRRNRTTADIPQHGEAPTGGLQRCAMTPRRASVTGCAC